VSLSIVSWAVNVDDSNQAHILLPIPITFREGYIFAILDRQPQYDWNARRMKVL
jgi:hypothetical protein